MYFVFHCIVSFPFFVQYISSEFYIMIVYESTKIYQRAHTHKHTIELMQKANEKLLKWMKMLYIFVEFCYIFSLFLSHSRTSSFNTQSFFPFSFVDPLFIIIAVYFFPSPENFYFKKLFLFEWRFCYCVGLYCLCDLKRQKSKKKISMFCH